MSASIQSVTVPAPRLQARQIVKRFNQNTVLYGVDLEIRAGEMLGLVGANGAGKSTLVKIICGALPPNSGEIIMDGTPLVLNSVGDALQAGITVAHQQVAIIPCLTGAQNIMLGREIKRGGLIDERAGVHVAEALAESFGVTIDLGIECARLSIGEQKILDVLKALARRPKLLILDEPTAALTLSESRRLFTFLEELKRQDLAILLISHHLKEITTHCERVIILKDGVKVHDGLTADITLPEIARLTVGRTITETDWTSHARSDSMAIRLRDLRFPHLHIPALDVRRGEIVGVAGVVGAGQTLLLERIAGVSHAASIEAAEIGQLDHLPRSVDEAVRNGIYLIPDNRALKAILQRLSVADNLLSGSLPLFSRYGFYRDKEANRHAGEAIDRLQVKCASKHQTVTELSGGNQQKVAFGRWISRIGRAPAETQTIFLLDNPTEGVDVGAKAEIYALIRRFAEAGTAILLSSMEFPELVALCDRVYCIAHETVSACIGHESLSEDRLMIEVN